jgi:hypothetical protein
MQFAYEGESFELVFEMYDPSDRDRRVDEGTFCVRGPDKSIVQSGALSIDEDGHKCRFRFDAKAVGSNSIELSWSMGMDRWKAVHLMQVKALDRGHRGQKHRPDA